MDCDAARVAKTYLSCHLGVHRVPMICGYHPSTHWSPRYALANMILIVVAAWEDVWRHLGMSTEKEQRSAMAQNLPSLH